MRKRRSLKKVEQVEEITLPYSSIALLFFLELPGGWGRKVEPRRISVEPSTEKGPRPTSRQEEV
jgi:hypothetical protein